MRPRAAGTLFAASAVAAGSVLSVVWWILRRKRKPVAAVVPEGFVKYELVLEDIMLQRVAATGTQTFFHGSMHSAVSFLRKQFRAMLVEHPWLAGRLVDDMGTLVVVHPAEISDACMERLMHVDPEAVSLHASMSALDMCKEAAKCGIPSGSAAIGDPNAPLVRLVVVPCRKPDGTPADTSAGGAADFAVIFYLSHVAGDAHTYYKLVSMLSMHAKDMKEQFNDQRKPIPSEQLENCLGMSPFKTLQSMPNFSSTLRLNRWFVR